MKSLIRPITLQLSDFSSPGEPRRDLIGNIGTLVAFLITCGLAMLFFFLYPLLFSERSAQDHYLVNLPLPGFTNLELLDGPEGTTIPENLNDKVVLLILWGPWDETSCQFLSTLAPLLKEMEDEKLVTIPVAYFAAPPRKDTMDILEDMGKYKAEVAAARAQKDPLRTEVERAYNRSGFTLPVVWWDPLNALRTNLLQLAYHSPEVNPDELDGIGYPTMIAAQHGIITAVWRGNAPQNLGEIKEFLIGATGKIPGGTLPGQTEAASPAVPRKSLETP